MSDDYQPRHAAYAPRHAGGLHPDEARILGMHEPRHGKPVDPAAETADAVRQLVRGTALASWPASPWVTR